jgi:hypothetical protein
MKTVDFNGELTPSGEIFVPPEIAAQVPRGERLKVTLHWGFSEDDAWPEAGRRQFASAYAEEDSVYESLMHEPPAR